MRKKIVFIVLCILFLCEIFYLQVSRKPTVDNIVTCADAVGYDAEITITMNKIVIFNQEKTEQDLLNRILENDFENMQFSYDVMGEPEEIKVTVYTNSFTKKLGIPAFEFRYSS